MIFGYMRLIHYADFVVRVCLKRIYFKANFISSDTTFCDETGKCIDFMDLSTGNPITWQWSFPGATPNNSNQQNPANICYYNPGTYPVTLIVSNSTAGDTLKVSPMIT